MLFDTNASRSVWDVFGDMQRVLDTFAQPATRAAYSMLGRDFPPANVWTKDDAVAVSVELPGVDTESIDLSVEGEVLTISGRRTSDLPEDAKVLRRERGELEFSRSIQLPFPVEADQAEARYTNGVLLVVLERKASDRPQRIKVTATS
jgi:HSP20 family protein